MNLKDYIETGLVQEVIEDGTNSFTLKICHLNKPNINGRVYTSDCFESLLDKKLSIPGRIKVSDLDTCDYIGHVEPNEVDFICTSLYIKDDIVYGNLIQVKDDVPLNRRKVYPMTIGIGKLNISTVKNFELAGIDLLLDDDL